ncbi:MAG: hypothetical protein QOG21_390 [Actinomycetota bacterium]|jgi:hypothetical protein|nr:hypothetical protein [Actinomycetota bacterium]
MTRLSWPRLFQAHMVPTCISQLAQPHAAESLASAGSQAGGATMTQTSLRNDDRTQSQPFVLIGWAD